MSKHKHLVMLIKIGIASAVLATNFPITDPVESAVWDNDLARVKVLIANGADVNVVNKYDYGRTALILAVQKGNVEITKALLAAGADANAKSTEGWPASGVTPRVFHQKR